MINGFPSSHIWMSGPCVDHKEDWVLKNWRFWTVVLEKTLESPLDSKEIKLVNPKRNQPWIFIERTDAEAEAPMLWPAEPTHRKRPWCWGRWRAGGVTEDEMFRWHHWLNGREFQQTPGDSEGQGSLVCCSPWGHKELDTIEQLNNNKIRLIPESA